MYNRSLNNRKWKSWLKGHLAGAEKPVLLLVCTLILMETTCKWALFVFAHPDTRATLMAPASPGGADDA